MTKITTPDGDKIEFSLQSYFDLHKLTRVRLYLKTERKAPTASKKRKQESDTASRTMLREAQDEEFAESLLADRAKKEKKEERLMEEVSKAKEVEEIYAARLRRVLDEPKEGEPQVVVRVRHVDLGLIQRTFKPYQAMAAVYDWVGSLQLIPVYFSLCMAPGNVLDPSLPVEDAEGVVLFMERREDPVPLAGDDAEISFIGFSQRGMPEHDSPYLGIDITQIGTTPSVNIFSSEMDSEEEGSST